MIKLSPSYDAAIVCMKVGISVQFAGIPDAKIGDDFYGLTIQHKGIEIPGEYQSVGYSTAHGLPGQKLDRQRLYYWIAVTPIFDLEVVGRTIANYLNKEHDLSVRILFETPNGQPDRVEVLMPKKNGDLRGRGIL